MIEIINFKNIENKLASFFDKCLKFKLQYDTKLNDCLLIYFYKKRVNFVFQTH